MADLVCEADQRSGGLVIKRLESMFDCICIDEVQDLVGHDLDLLDRLFAADLEVLLVGDPRQFTYSTSDTSRNKKYRGAGFADWLSERSSLCVREDRHESARCNQEICDFASALFPSEPAMGSANHDRTGHDGIFKLRESEVPRYVKDYQPQVLRNKKTSNTLGYPAMNFGVSKGSTFDRVLIFPTKPMLQYLQHGDVSKLKDPHRFYVAVTRARFSVAFVVGK
ncbi:MAG: UvrD-helicase domain-containing protein [Thermoleophilaceae bacterium]|nr:UvrD-helicase domain-containing protein [Thermoleophilaceae bacterium]